MNSWNKIILGLLVFILLFLGALTFIVNTTTGLHLLFKAVNSFLLPGLEISNMSGCLRDFKIKNISYEQPNLAITVGEFNLAVTLGCLRDSSICLDDLWLKDVKVTISKFELVEYEDLQQQTTTTTTSNKIFNNLYSVVIKNINLKNINIKIDDTTVSIMHLSSISGFELKDKNLTIKPMYLNGLLIALPMPNPNVAQQEYTLESKQLGDRLDRLINQFSKKIKPDQLKINLPLNINIEEFNGEQLLFTSNRKDHTYLHVHNMLLKGSSIDGNINLDLLDIYSNYGMVKATGNAKLCDNLPVDITINSRLNIANLKGDKVNLKVWGAMLEKLYIMVKLSGTMNIVLHAQTQLAEVGMPLNIEIFCYDLLWQFTEDKLYKAEELKFKLSGNITNYTIYLRTKGRLLSPATIKLDANANWNEQKTNIDKMPVLKGKTELELTALLYLHLQQQAQAISWRGEIKLYGINTETPVTNFNLPSQLNGLIKTSGSLYCCNKWHINIPNIKITGQFNQNKVIVEGSLIWNNYNYLQLVIPNLHFELGSNSADIKGKLNVKDLNFDATINAPYLEHVLPGLVGKAKGILKVRGTVDTPQFIADITAGGMRWKDISVASLRLETDALYTDHIFGNLKVQVECIAQPKLNININKVKLNAKGSDKQHKLKLLVQGSPVSGQLHLAGSFDRQYSSWKVTLDDNTSFITQVRAWFLPISGLDNYYYSNSKNKNTTTTNKEAQLPMKLDKLNLTLDMHNQHAELGWLICSNISSSSSIHKQNNLQFYGNIIITDLQKMRNLIGTVKISNLNINSILSLSHGEKAIGMGMLNANIRLAGNAHRPQLFGNMHINGIYIDGNLMPLDMQPSQLTINFKGMSSTIHGVVRTKQGQIINLSGDADWSNIDNWRASLAAKGSSIRITVPPMVYMDVSTNVVLKATPSLLTLNGRFDIPWARIVVHELPESAVGVSSDEVMLNQNITNTKVDINKSNIKINSNILVHLGNNVRIDSFGLKARLTGYLKLVQDKQRLGLNGQVNIPEGRFHAYGQDMIVRKGELLFFGPPDQPIFNIEAIRNPDYTDNYVIVGVRVTGTADEPKAEIFSEPAMSQQEALSYMLHGQGLDNNQSDSAAITSILVGLGIAQSGQVVGKIGDTFGVSNLALDTQGVGDSSQVVISGYILPSLQVKYGFGIFDALARLTLRYRLMPKLYIEAVSGINQALDFIYQLEF